MLTLSWLGGAGFIIRTHNTTIGIDLYLSNACMRPSGEFKRLIPPPVTAMELDLDYLISSHEHGDHLDRGSLRDLLRADNTTKLIGPFTALNEARQILGNAAGPERFIPLDRGNTFLCPPLTVQAVMADHGDQSPDAIGCFITVEGKTVYFVGDTCFRTDFLTCIGEHPPIDVMLVPINGRFGNPDGRDAAYFMQMLKPALTVPCHYWLFMEHGGDPSHFAKCAEQLAPDCAYAVMAVGECLCI